MKENSDWSSLRIEEVCEIEYGTRVTRKKDEGTIYPVYGGGGATFKIDCYNRENCVIISRFAMSEKTVRRVNGRFFLNDSGLSLKSKNPQQLTTRYLEWSLFGLNDIIYSLGRGTAQKNLNINAFKALLIKFPNSLEQQKIIVSKLDQAFEAIDQAIANTEKIIENVDELFQSQLDFLFSYKDDSWSTNSLSEIATLKYGYTEKSADTGHYRYIRITDIDKQGKLRTETKQYLAYSLEAEKYLLKHNDLLMARTGATHGKVLLYDNIEPSIYASYLIRIDFNIPIDNEVYWFFSKSKSYWKQASQLSSGSAQPQFNGNALKKVSFSYPRQKDDQDNLKEKCRAIFESTENLKQQYTAKLNELESLKMSILEKAFKGELI